MGMKTAIWLLEFAATAFAAAAPLEPVRPTASAGLSFEPNAGQVVQTNKLHLPPLQGRSGKFNKIAANAKHHHS